MQIYELELNTGLDRTTIRYYEKEGMITPERRENGYRDYSEDDLQQLMKIKLLRQLGVSLLKIKQLQQGSADFQEVLREQIQLLEKQRDSAQRSSQVCRLMQADGVTYTGMDANYYLEKFRSVQLVYPQNPISPPKPNSPFQEDVPIEFHPWRRFFARNLDVTFLYALIIFIQIVFFRTRLDTLLFSGIPLLLLWIPLEALCYTLFGTTPGKFAMGIRVEHVDGTKHSYWTALKRAFGAYRYGEGWGIPIWSIWRHYKSYRDYKDGWDNEWNEDSEISYFRFYYWRDLWRPLVVFAVIIAMFATSISLLFTPKYNTEDLTLQQFVTNYNSYLHPDGGSSRIALKEDGTFLNENTGNGVVIVIGGRTGGDYADLQYIMEGERVRGFSCSDQYTYEGMISVLESQYKYGIMALLASQPGEDTVSAEKFLQELMSAMKNALESGKTSVIYENDKICVQWSIVYDGEGRFAYLSNNLALLLSDDGGREHTAKTYIRVELKNE